MEKVKEYHPTLAARIRNAASYCKHPGCFEFSTEEGGFCVEHRHASAVRGISADIKECSAIVARSSRVKSEIIAEYDGRTRSRSPTTATGASASSPRLEKLKKLCSHLSTPELETLDKYVVSELERRAEALMKK